ncbi:hypothetical protein GUITHDRAFT_119326 [Guillardia theta CCMP2712]|uniref:Uncharacterized protein n=1 Tax=Guillardia theta (strain CCMP2712) TaxID=905079 RepID=L1IEZ1_GUITC|nr:hypothetical protein GUITHDRAFT_119326 [Guillardia theta CCMP2712]EKX34489.1 hypothetical protein GUITHDRAFT_119326 [Guillardia theta CCMP2712]|eukprot:XP_005821469.1 hypothetical protein GUITHDRAFT_119326 [Guillardia theta CCMP2712]
MSSNQKGRARWVRTRLSSEIIDDSFQVKVDSSMPMAGQPPCISPSRVTSSYAGWILQGWQGKKEGEEEEEDALPSPLLVEDELGDIPSQLRKEPRRELNFTSFGSMLSPKRNFFSPRDFDSCCDASDFACSVGSYETQDTLQSKTLLAKLEHAEREKEGLVIALSDLEHRISASVAELERQTQTALRKSNKEVKCEDEGKAVERSLNLLRTTLEDVDGEDDWEEMKQKVEAILEEVANKRGKQQKLKEKEVGRLLLHKSRFCSSCHSQNPMEDCLSPRENKYDFLIDA